ncbi:MAG: TPM domain-containing protein [Gammaproteobacteria bacterium]|nr:TPM domain-containing protein [Gammaproteobacteria bacterium]
MKTFIVAVACLFASGVFGAEDSAIPALSGRVVDQANILTPATEQRLTAQLQAHDKAGGNQVVVATIESLGGETIETYGVRLGRSWGIGQAGDDNGIVLIVAPNERKVRIEVGYGLEGDIPDAIASNIIQAKILPRFWENDFDGGVTAGVTAIIAALGGEYVFEQERRGRRNREGGFPFGILWIVVLFVLFGMGRRRRRGLGSGLLWGAVLGGALSSGRGGGFGGGGFGGGGGFSGGGGSFGGGGASGGW